ncbi:hypothetical protein GGG16DRAFT_109125 [Schizophyllum commune]
MHRKIARRGDCVTCHRTIIPTETNTAMELRKETFHDGTLLCQYQSVVKKSDGDGDEGSSVDDGDGEDELEPKDEDVEEDEDGDEDEEDKEDDEEDAKEDKGDEEDRDDDEDDADEDADKDDDEVKEDEEDKKDEDEKDEDEADEDEEDEEEKDEEECDPNDKYERRALGTHLNGALDLRGRDDDSEQSDIYTVEYDCVYDVASGNLLEDQARSCPPVVSSSC